jgi:hypothetical protein
MFTIFEVIEKRLDLTKNFKYYKMQRVSFIIDQSIVTLSHGKPVSALASSDSCGAKVTDTRNCLVFCKPQSLSS